MNKNFFRTALVAAAASMAFVSSAAYAQRQQSFTSFLLQPLGKVYDDTTSGTVASQTTEQADACKGCWIEIESMVFTGAADHDWFNPNNWSAGRVPGPADNVILDGTDYAVIDAAANRAGTHVQFNKLTVRDAAVFEARNGAVVQTQEQVAHDNGQILFRGSADIGETLIVGGRSESSTTAASVSEVVVTRLELNPTSQNKRTTVLKSSFEAMTEVDVGLGGNTPAGIGDVNSDGVPDVIAGPGTYATMVADTLVLGGELRLSTYYGFQPLHGDTFQIMTANRTRDGEFDGLPEGGYVGCMDQNVCLRISYRGGDGNDVVLSAENTDPATALLIGLLVPAIQQVIATPTVEQTREHILLARQVGVPVLEETASKLPAPTTPISTPPPPTK